MQSQVPLQRWDVDAMYDPEGGSGRLYTRLGAFVPVSDSNLPPAYDYLQPFTLLTTTKVKKRFTSGGSVLVRGGFHASKASWVSDHESLVTAVLFSHAFGSPFAWMCSQLWLV